MRSPNRVRKDVIDMARKNDILDIFVKQVDGIREAGTLKGEAPLVSPQGSRVITQDGRELLVCVQITT